MAKANNVPHDNVLAYLGTATFEHENKSWAWMVVPDMPEGDLRGWFAKNDAPGEPEMCLRLVRLPFFSFHLTAGLIAPFSSGTFWKVSSTSMTMMLSMET